MGFEIISKITQIEPIARGVGVRDRQRLNRMYADGRLMRWRKLKGLLSCVGKVGIPIRPKYIGMRGMVLVEWKRKL